MSIPLVSVLLFLYVIVVNVAFPNLPMVCIDVFSGATTSSVRDVSAGGKESEGEVGRAKDAGVNIHSKPSHSHSVGITNENEDSIDIDQVSLI